MLEYLVSIADPVWGHTCSVGNIHSFVATELDLFFCGICDWEWLLR